MIARRRAILPQGGGRFWPCSSDRRRRPRVAEGRGGHAEPNCWEACRRVNSTGDDTAALVEGCVRAGAEIQPWARRERPGRPRRARGASADSKRSAARRLGECERRTRTDQPQPPWLQLDLPGVSVPTMVGPFGVADARVYTLPADLQLVRYQATGSRRRSPNERHEYTDQERPRPGDPQPRATRISR